MICIRKASDWPERLCAEFGTCAAEALGYEVHVRDVVRHLARPRAAWSMFCAISEVAAFCSSTALEIDRGIELTSAIVPAIEFMITIVPCVNS